MSLIQVDHLTKTFKNVHAVNDLSFVVEPGTVTGFLGPNGAGKSTTMRMILSLDKPDRGTALIDGKKYEDSPAPLTTVGALLDAKFVNPKVTARAHLKQLAYSNNIPQTRVDEVLDLTGIASVAKKRVKTFSLGMGQRLGIAAALLGNPSNLMFDEPVNGLDPEGVKWVREFCKYLASEGRTVFVSSHLMSEMSLMADHLIVIGQGRMLAQGKVDDIISSVGHSKVRVTSPQVKDLIPLLQQRGGTVQTTNETTIEVSGLDTPAISTIAAEKGIPLHELTTVEATLEEAFFTLTHNSVEYSAGTPAQGTHTRGEQR